MDRLNGTTALVTGASKGIGRGIAQELAAEGAAVGVNYPPQEGPTHAEDVVETIESNGGTARAFEADVSDADDVESMIDAVEAAFGTIDVLVNNAGILTQSRLEEMPVEMWDETIAVDLRGTFLPIRFALPGMLESGGGSIINVASQLGIVGGEELVHYSAAKGGVISMTRALAREVSPTVRVNAVAPGPVQTELLDDISEEWREAKEASLPMGRLGEVEDITPTVVFLASDESSYYTGQTLSPDGGDAMH
ncbi:SDR family NAD(P)-dependent oxidoreductase [Natronorubrum texcoconense]|uniref:3-oxoacyl-[acyl-carrier protein] reductase n=1 Tax=Natronorubrum texcoconense TaxID=1095776 RepID=A0A1G9CZ64_9EURY|nr:3-oxoacyl-ACP reductase family protein [Natronorubrum texcoconense]SDK56940.1 3-oxoacyl-[acyl-carrier protein] reductase [Natronorubrum texcoconense]